MSMSVGILLISALRALVEVALLFLSGQGILYVLAGQRREQNVIYRLFQLLTRPVLGAARMLMPRVVIDRHLPMLTFLILLWAWLALAFLRRWLCGEHGLVCN